MSRNAYLAGILSLVAPGLGQIFARKGTRGAATLIAAITVANLNALWLDLHTSGNPNAEALWSSLLPRILHGLFAAHGVLFWLWQVIRVPTGITSVPGSVGQPSLIELQCRAVEPYRGRDSSYMLSER